MLTAGIFKLMRRVMQSWAEKASFSSPTTCLFYTVCQRGSIRFTGQGVGAWIVSSCIPEMPEAHTRAWLVWHFGPKAEASGLNPSLILLSGTWGPQQKANADRVLWVQIRFQMPRSLQRGTAPQRKNGHPKLSSWPPCKSRIWSLGLKTPHLFQAGRCGGTAAVGADGQTACLDRHRVLVHLTRGDGVMNEFCYSSCHPDRKSTM